MQNSEVDRINKELATSYGREDNGNPRFRVAWADEQLEYRTGEFKEYYSSLYLRTVKTTKLVPKYSYLKQRWILERWFTGDRTNTSVLPLSENGGYEIIYVFEDALGNSLPPKLKVCQVICWQILNDRASFSERKAVLEEYMKGLDEEEMKYYDDVLREASPYLVGKFHEGSAVLNAKKEE